MVDVLHGSAGLRATRKMGAWMPMSAAVEMPRSSLVWGFSHADSEPNSENVLRMPVIHPLSCRMQPGGTTPSPGGGCGNPA